MISTASSAERPSSGAPAAWEEIPWKVKNTRKLARNLSSPIVLFVVLGCQVIAISQSLKYPSRTRYAFPPAFSSAGQVRSTFGTIKKDPVSLEDKITSVLGYARKHRKFSFRQMLEKQNDKTEVVVTFLALLELMKVGKIHLTQEHLFDDMCIESLEPEGEEEDIAIDVTTAQ